MTIEERVEFLHQSIESHDRQIGDLVDKMAATAARLDRFIEVSQSNFDRFQLNMDRLTTAMLGLTEHVTDHQRRIEHLES